MTSRPDHDLFGAGGKGGGAEAENTLRSNARADIIELISEGPCVGLVRGAKGIYLDQTPLRNENGSANFKGVAWEQRFGTPDQPFFKGANRVETPVSVEVRVRKNESPPIRTILDDNADRVRVVMRIPALTYRKKKGELVATDVSFAIDVRPAGQNWKLAKKVDIKKQKFTSPVQFDYVIDLPPGGSPWDIRVRRLTDDATELKMQNETWWEAMYVIVNGKFSYPNSALVRLEVDAEDFGQNVPTRYYHYKGLKVQVPQNYNPVTREYTGVWNGQFKIAWTNNPAWVFYDLITNDRYGLGDWIDATKVDKWGLYEIAQYCDQEVRTGERRANGTWKMEPRYTFNGRIADRQEAYRVLQNIVATWRGMAYWSLGQVFATCDKPADPVKLVTPANVVGGVFNYSGSAIKARPTVALVSWNNPDDFFRESIEVVIDQDGLEKYGWRETEVRMEGCTSRGQAHRYGEWLLDTNRSEAETVDYTASWDHAELKPGDIIAISDPAKANIRAGGRIVAYNAAAKTVELDGNPVMGAGTWSLMVTHADGTVTTTQIASLGTVNAAGHRVVTLVSALPKSVLPGAMFVITGNNLVPRKYRVISIAEEEPHLFKVTAMFHDPTKYARVERDKALRPPIYTRPDRVVDPVENLQVQEILQTKPGTIVSCFVVSWTPARDQLVRRYRVRVTGPDGTKSIPDVRTPYVEYFPDIREGEYTFSVQAVDTEGRVSVPRFVTINAQGAGILPDGDLKPAVVNLRHIGLSPTTFAGRDVRIEWDNYFPESDADDEPISVPEGEGKTAGDPLYAFNTVRVYDVNSGGLLRQQKVKRDSYTYTFEYNRKDNAAFGRKASRAIRFDVTATDTVGTVSDTATLTVSNPVPLLATPTVSASVGQILVVCQEPDDEDFKGVKIWLSGISGFNPNTTPPAYQGPNTSVTFQATPGATYYVRAAAYDGFNETGLSITPEVSVVVPTATVDFDPPGVPTGLALTSAITVETDGSISAKLIATWNAVTATDLANYDIEIKEGAGSYIPFTVAGTRLEQFVRPATLYSARVRARDISGNLSAWSSVVTHTTVGDTVAPAVPTGLTATGVFKAIWLSWNPVADKDLAAYEIYTATTNSAPSAGTAPTFVTGATAFVHDNLGSLVQRYYWVRAVDTSGNKSAWTAGVNATTKRLDNAGDVATIIGPTHITTGTLEAVAATIGTAWISNAHIVELNAAKIMAGTAIATSITVNGQALGTVQQNANDPIGKINSMSTQIDPGRILVSGATTLADWRNGGDQTSIEGGKIAANTISANKLQIGMRNIGVEGVTFEANKPATNQVSWTTGTIAYVADNGTQTSVAIAAGNATWTTGTLFVYWVKGTGTLATTTTAATAYGANNVVLARYRGNVDLDSSGGRTIIDGSFIKTGSIDTAQLKAGAIKAGVIDAGAIQAVHVAANQINGTHINAGSITASKILVGDKSNVYPDYDFADPGFYSALGVADYAIGRTGLAYNGEYQLRVGFDPLNLVNYEVQSDFFALQQNTEYLVEGVCRVSAGARLYIRLYSVDAAGAVTQTSVPIIFNGPVSGKQTGTFTTGPADTRGKLRFLNLATATQDAYFSAISIRRKQDASLIVDGSIQANHIKVRTIEAQNIKIRGVDITNFAVGAAVQTLEDSTSSPVTLNATTGANNYATRGFNAYDGTDDAYASRFLVSVAISLTGAAQANNIIARLQLGVSGVWADEDVFTLGDTRTGSYRFHLYSDTINRNDWEMRIRFENTGANSCNLSQRKVLWTRFKKS